MLRYRIGKLPVYHIVVTLVVLCMLAGCTQSSAANFPKEEVFDVTLDIPDQVVASSRPFEIQASLVNQSEHRIKVIHGTPLIIFEIRGNDGMEIQPSVRLMNGIDHELAPGAVYDPDTGNTELNRRTLRIYQPGRYDITAVAYFSMLVPYQREAREYEIRSDTMELYVE